MVVYLGEVVVILLCLLAAAFLSGIETGVIGICRVRLRHFVRQGDKAARILQAYLDEPDRLFGTTLVGTNICLVAATVLAEGMVADLPGHWWELAVTAVMAIVILVFSEYLPKAWFYSRPFERSRRFAMELRLAEMLLTPVSGAVLWIIDRLLPGKDQAFPKATPFVTRDDLKALVHEGEKGGILTGHERAMIHGVFDLSGKRAKDIMIPRASVTVVPSDMSVSDFLELARKSKFTRMPVFDDASRKFIGVINLFFVVSTIDEARNKTAADFARKPLMISENMPIDDVIPLIRRARQPMVFVTDDKSEVVGLITDEDILEEIVGKL